MFSGGLFDDSELFFSFVCPVQQKFIEEWCGRVTLLERYKVNGFGERGRESTCLGYPQNPKTRENAKNCGKTTQELNSSEICDQCEA